MAGDADDPMPFLWEQALPESYGPHPCVHQVEQTRTDRFGVRMRLRVNAEKREVRSFGFRTGYWYCIPSIFVQVNVGRRYWSFWVESGDHRWTPEELSADRRFETPDELKGLLHELLGYTPEYFVEKWGLDEEVKKWTK
jgi:hypothetical protein